MVAAMLRGFAIAGLLACLVAAPRAQAHPHVFVDVGLRFEADAQGQVTGVEVTWAYDALFTLLILSDYGLDGDADMVLTEAEREVLAGFDLMDWPEGFDGALFIEAGSGPVLLGSPKAVSVHIEDGRLITRHRRPLGPVAPGGLTVQPYDPYYYAALSLTGEVALPEGCTGQVQGADRAAADARVDDLGGAQNEATFEEARVGVYYADTLVVACE